MFVDGLLINNAFKTLERLPVVELHITYDVTARKDVVRVKDEAGASFNIPAFVLSRDVDNSRSAQMKEKIGSKSRSQPKVSLTPSLRKSVQKR